MTRLIAILLFLALGALAVTTWSPATQAAPPSGGLVVDFADVTDIARPLVLDDGTRLALDREVVIHGDGFFGTAFGPFVHFEESDGTRHEAVTVVMPSAQEIVASPPPGLRGPITVIVENPDRATARTDVGL